MTPPTWLFLVAGILFIALGAPMMLRKVPPNHVYGVRVPATLRDERVWYDTNAVSGRDIMVLGAVLVLGKIVLPLIVKPDIEVLTQIMVLVVGSVGLAIRGVLLSMRLEARYRDERDGD